jgi:4-hydroxybenzoate polyprenyltransferase
MAGGRAEGTKKYLAMFGAASTAGLCAAGHAAGVGPVFYVGAAASAAHLAWQVRDVNLDDGEDCASKFRSNGTQYGAIVFAACVAGKLSGV